MCVCVVYLFPPIPPPRHFHVSPKDLMGDLEAVLQTNGRSNLGGRRKGGSGGRVGEGVEVRRKA